MPSGAVVDVEFFDSTIQSRVEPKAHCEVHILSIYFEIERYKGIRQNPTDLVPFTHL